jgi:alanine-synthesizing transaminase
LGRSKKKEVFAILEEQKILRRNEIKPSERSGNLEYAIRDLISRAREIRKEVIFLNIGDPVKFGFETPRHVKDELLKSVERGFNYYTDSEGLPELREAIAERETRKSGVSIYKEDVIVTAGVSEAISMVMGALVNEGDEILVPGPCYPPYISYLKFFGGVPIEYETKEEFGWRPDIQDLRAKVTKRTKAIVVINPNNPTGSVYGHSTLKEICSVASENNLLIVSDEIYDEITYDVSFQSISTLSDDVPVVGLNGFSKSSLMTGWRLGYLYFKSNNCFLDNFKEAVAKQARIRLCANTPMQKAAVAALRGPRHHVVDMVKELKRRRDYAWKRINEIPGLSSSKPEGAFYLFPKIEGHRWSSDVDFVLDVLNETGVLLVPGSGFGKVFGSNHFRIVFLPPIDTLENALNRLEEFMSKAVKYNNL